MLNLLLDGGGSKQSTSSKQPEQPRGSAADTSWSLARDEIRSRQVAPWQPGAASDTVPHPAQGQKESALSRMTDEELMRLAGCDV